MPNRATVPPFRRALRPGLTVFGDVADIVMGAVWVSVCAASLEFIWRGVQLVHGHVGVAELWTAIPLGFVLAFFVEPLFERLRHTLTGHPLPRPQTGRGAAFHTLIGVVFALCAVCVHHAMTAVITAHRPVSPGQENGIAPAIALTVGWALAPFAITLAWRSVRRPALCAVLTLLSVAAPLIAGLAFDWSRGDIVDTTLPCTAILLVNLVRLRRGAPWRTGLRTVAQIGALWLVAALLIDLILDATGNKRLSLYSPAGYWMDVRFYLGWLAGLWLVPPDIVAATAGSEATAPGTDADAVPRAAE